MRYDEIDKGKTKKKITNRKDYVVDNIIYYNEKSKEYFFTADCAKFFAILHSLSINLFEVE